MGKLNQKITDKYAIYNGDCVNILPSFSDNSIHLTIYSPPFADLYNYSSSDNDMSNCRTVNDFLDHYSFLVKEIYRIMLPGRLSVVHCTDIPNKGSKGMRDFTGDIIRLHQKLGFYYHARYSIWKEPLRVAIRTRSKGLMHKQIVNDSSFCNNATADYILVFRKQGLNSIPIKHPIGLSYYAGEREVPSTLKNKYKNWKNPKTNKLSHWIWQQYASSFWDDIRINNVLPYKESKEPDDEKHVCPLQLDVIERCIILWSNIGETILTPFMGVGSEVYSALLKGRKGIGIELKLSYYNQAVLNLKMLKNRKVNFF